MLKIALIIPYPRKQKATLDQSATLNKTSLFFPKVHFLKKIFDQILQNLNIVPPVNPHISIERQRFICTAMVGTFEANNFEIKTPLSKQHLTSATVVFMGIQFKGDVIQISPTTVVGTMIGQIMGTEVRNLRKCGRKF